MLPRGGYQKRDEDRLDPGYGKATENDWLGLPLCGVAASEEGRLDHPWSEYASPAIDKRVKNNGLTTCGPDTPSCQQIGD